MQFRALLMTFFISGYSAGAPEFSRGAANGEQSELLAAGGVGPLDVVNPRGSDSPSFRRPKVYDYAPTVMLDGVYRMWWCGGIAGDHILYAEASSLDGPWHAHGSTVPNSFNDVFAPTGHAQDFDAVHTCDPSVVRRRDGSYLMYYGGYGDQTHITEIGVATSLDGFSWSRLNNGKPIFVPARPALGGYGAGQPSAIELEGKIYLAYTDTTGLGSNSVNGAGIYFLRSSDPTFNTGVEEVGPNGFVPMTASRHTAYAPVQSFSIDWMYADALDAFVVASNNSADVTFLWLFDRSLKPLPNGNGSFEVQGAWTEGPGIVTRPDKHALPNGNCTDIKVDLMRSVADGTGLQGPNGWDLAHDGIDLRLRNASCSNVPLGGMYDGFRLVSPNLPLALVLDGRRLQFAMSAPALRLSNNETQVASAIYEAIPYAGSVAAQARVIAAPGEPAAYVLDTQTLAPLGCPQLIADTNSTLENVSNQDFAAYPVGPNLFCIH